MTKPCLSPITDPKHRGNRKGGLAFLFAVKLFSEKGTFGRQGVAHLHCFLSDGLYLFKQTLSIT